MFNEHELIFMMCRWHQLNLSFCTKYILGQCMANSFLRFGRKKNRCIIASQPKAMHRCTTSTSCCLCRMSGTDHIPCHVKVQEKTLEVQINIYQGSAWRQEAYLARTSFFLLLLQESGDLAAIQEELMEENSLSDLLLTGAEAVEAGDSSLASVVFSKLDGLLPVACENAASSSFDRLAYHFAKGLQSRMSGACSPCYPPEPVQSGTMSVQQMIQELSPFVKFTHFTANQAILDATTGIMDVHVIDFNLGEGVQWPSLMSDLARQGGKSFHLTAIITDAGYCNNTDHIAARCLVEFAESLNLPFQYSSVCIQSEEDLEDFSRNLEGSVVVSCDTTNLCYKLRNKLQMLLLGCVKKLQPTLVVIIEEELVGFGKETFLSQGSFVEFFFEALHHFTMVFESLASCFRSNNNRILLRLVERDMVGPKILDFVGHYGSVTLEAPPSKDLEGFMPCELSAHNIAQARMLAALFNKSFGIAHEKGRLQLCWKSRPLISVSVWTPV